MEYNSTWFKHNLENFFYAYTVEYRYFPKGDFGFLDEVSFDNKYKGGVINYWGQGYLGVFLYDNIERKELLNILLEPHQVVEKEDTIKQLILLL